MREKQSASLFGYLMSVAVSAIVTGLVVVARASLGLVDPPSSLTVVIVGTRFGRGPALMSTALSVLALDYFVIPPVPAIRDHRFPPYRDVGRHWLSCGHCHNLTERLRKERDRAVVREKQTEEARQAVEAERTRNAILSTVSYDCGLPSRRSRHRLSYWLEATPR